MGKNSKMDSGGQPSSPEEEPPRDPGVAKYHSYTNEDLEGHRAHSIYLGVHVPGARRRPRHRHHRHHHHHKSSSKDGSENRPVTPPSQRVQFILGEDDDDDGTHLSHPLFSEMETLTEMEGGELEWKETARWVKFEEDVEEGGERWSKPHVATLSLHSLFELRSFLLNGTVILDMDASSLEQITDLLLDNMINQGQLTYESREKFKDALLRKHKHLYEKQKNSKENGNMSRLPLIRSLAEIGRNHSSSKSFMDILSSGIKRSNTGPVPTVTVHEAARMRSNSTPTPSHLLHPPVGPNYGTHLEVPRRSSEIPAWLSWRRHSTGIVEEGGASTQASPTPTPTSLGEPTKFGRFLNVPGTGGGGGGGGGGCGGGGGGGGGTTAGKNPTTFLKIIRETFVMRLSCIML